MGIKELILKQLKRRDSVKVSDIVKETNFSRTYINKVLKEMREDGEVVLLGRANQARYVKAEKEKILKEKRKILKISSKSENLCQNCSLATVP